MFTSLSSASYDRRTIALHWATAILILALWVLGQTIDWFPKGLPRTYGRSTHILLGTLVAGVIAYRIWWRITSGRRLAPADRGLLQVLATLTHRLLYVLACSTVALGMTNAWIRGDSIFDLFSIPSFNPANKPLRSSIEELHGLSANILISLAGLHALAGLFHQFILKDRLLRRMIFP